MSDAEMLRAWYFEKWLRILNRDILPTWGDI